MSRINKISERIAVFKVISFDIFDTLIKRDVATPTAVFNYIEAEYNKRHPDVKMNGFREKRMDAEAKARKEKYPGEVTLEEIYSFCEVPDRIEISKLEEDIEILLCHPNKAVVDQYYNCLKSGKTVIITSDMYLPKATIMQMLSKCGIEGYDKLYLSSDIGKKKSTGELFDYIIRDLSVAGKDIMHIGDSISTDYLMPRKKGMGSFHVARAVENTAFLSKEDIAESEGTIFAFINNRLPYYEDKSRAFRWGYEAFGPLLLGFCEWVYKNARGKNSKVFLLARDMNLIRMIYEKYYPAFSKSTVYLEVSRRSLRRSYVIKKGNLLSILDTMTRRDYKVEYLLSVLGLPEASIRDLGGKYNLQEKVGLTSNKPAWMPSLDSDLMAILNCEPDLAYEYLKYCGVLDEPKPVIVDIGWHGTIQNILETVIERPVEGLYFGITRREYFKSMDMKGYWFYLENEEDSYQYISLISILETMLFAQIGTTIGYTRDGESIKPVYNAAEVTDFSFVGDFQAGALQFISDYKRQFGDIQPIPAQVAAYAFEMLAFTPTRAQIEVIGEIPYEEEKTFHLVEKQNRIRYLVNPVNIVRDYDNSRWKTGYLKWFFPFVSKPNRIEVLIRNRRKLFQKKARLNRA